MRSGLADRKGTRMRRQWMWVLLLVWWPGVHACSEPEIASDSLEERIAWLREHTIPIRTISPEDQDFSDLAPLAAVLKDVRVVLLGEQSHADGAAFVAKHRLVRFLHQELGFGLLAFEANREALRRVDQGLEGGQAVPSITGPLPRMWGESEYVRDVLEYSRQTRHGDDPLRVGGFDIQVAPRTVTVYREALHELIDSVAPELAGGSEVREVDSMLAPAGLVAGGADGASEEEYMEGMRVVEELTQQISRSAMGRHAAVDRLVRLLKDIQSALTLASRADRGFTAVRDEAMAENVNWLLEREPGAIEGVIGWAHSGHIAKRLRDIEVVDGAFSWENEKPMGEYLAERLGDQIYSVGFLAFGGEAGQVLPDTSYIREIPVPSVGSLDWLLGELKEPYLFLDLRSVPADHWLRDTIVARPVYSDMSAVWPEIYDGLVFTRQMFANRRVAPLGSSK